MSESFVAEDFDYIETGLRVVPGNGSGNSFKHCEKWDAPKSSTEIAAILKTDRRNVANWYPAIKRAWCWLPESELKLGTGKATRYTPHCCAQMESLQQATAEGYAYEDWIACIHAQYPDDLEAWMRLQQPDESDSAALPVTAELDDSPSSGQLIRSANPIVGFTGGIQTLNINITVANTEQLDTERHQFVNTAAQAFQALQHITTSELKADIQEMRAQNKHAVAAIQAKAAVDVAQELAACQQGKPQNVGSGAASQ